jgi:hypothetical protein
MGAIARGQETLTTDRVTSVLVAVAWKSGWGKRFLMGGID